MRMPTLKGMLEITAEDIANLDDADLRTLVGYLLRG
jgi:hypothetical protein